VAFINKESIDMKINTSVQLLCMKKIMTSFIEDKRKPKLQRVGMQQLCWHNLKHNRYVCKLEINNEALPVRFDNSINLLTTLIKQSHRDKIL